MWARSSSWTDSFAGRGRFEDGSPGSAELILRMAATQKASVGLTWTCFFVERDRTSATALAGVVAEYADDGRSG
jgi:hypothetical protein